MNDRTPCAECNISLSPDDPQVDTGSGIFCQNCYQQIRRGIEQAIASQGQGINWALALVGGIGGGVLGALVWWGFTVATNIAFGLVAIVIGIAVGKGIVLLTGKRALSLQVLSVVISVVSFGAATYMVTRSFVIEAYGEDALPLIPDPALFMEIVSADFGLMDLVFLAIVVWEAWKTPAPLEIGG